jgi:serine/threonine protein kinase
VIFNKPFGRFRLAKKLAMGGMAEVYLALRSGPKTFDKLIALKCILPHVNDDAAHVAMFYNEARVGGLFRHPNLISVHDAEQIDGRHTLVMEYVAGQTLEELATRLEQNRESIPLDIALYLVGQAARGLAHAHEVRDLDGARLDLVHRDVSPQNIMLAHDGRVKVFDFGVAVAAAQGTEARELAGKAAYMSPEQVRGRALDNRSDLFSLGVILHELVTGEKLFHRDNQMATIVAVTDTPIPVPSTRRDSVPPEVDEIVMRCLARNVDERWENGWDLADALDGVLTQLNSDIEQERLGRYVSSRFGNEIGEIEAVVQKVLQAPEHSDATIDLSTFDVRTTRTTTAITGSMPVPRGIARDEGKGLESLKSEAEDPELPPVPRSVDSVIPSEASAALLTQLQRARRTNRLLVALAGVLVASLVLFALTYPSLFVERAPDGTVQSPTATGPVGFIVLTSEPAGATILLDGVDTGRVTPAQLQVTPGVAHAVQLQSEGWLSIDLTVTPTEDTPSVVAAQLERDPNSAANQNGSVRITFEPADALLYVNGTLVPGQSPLQVPALELFTDHEIRIEKLGFETTTDVVRLESEDTLNVQFALVPAQAVGVVNIRSTPAGANILINGELVGVTPLENLSLVADQEYQIALEKDGARWRTRVTLDPDSVQNIDATLQRDRPAAPAPRPSEPSQGGNDAPPAAPEPPAPAPEEPRQPSYQLLD